MSAPTPYRLTVDPPVCANCMHRADARMMDKVEPWRDWFCMAAVSKVWPPEFNPITGTTKPGWNSYARCADVNSVGSCTLFEPGAVSTKTIRDGPGPAVREGVVKRLMRRIREGASS